jgi:hypothetical protein
MIRMKTGLADLPDFVDIQVKDRARARLPIDHAEDGECKSVRVAENDIADGGELLSLGNDRGLEALFGDELLGQIDGKRLGGISGWPK